MQITKQADYGIRAIRYLAQQATDQRVSTATVAREMNIPPSFLTKIVAQLSISGLLRTSRGARGGVSLGRAPKDISVLEVVEAIDGPILLNQCAESPHDCGVKEQCQVHPIWQEVQENLVTRLGATRFDVSLN